MRAIDRKRNLKNANVLFEQRYLSEKGLVNENETAIDRMYNSDEWVDAQKNAGKDIETFKSDYTSSLYQLEKPYLKGNDEELETIIKIYQSHIQGLSNILRQNKGEI